MAIIKSKQFAGLLRSALEASAKQKHQKFEIPKRIGLAVSGGADSLALAHLARTLKYFKNDFDQTEFHAITIDHGIREESAKEAEEVEKVVSTFGIQTHLRKSNYDFDVARNTVETKAREQRYRILAETCLENDISYLLTGHHKNDQAETVLMRLISGSGSAGLAGMQPFAKIPECDKIFGAGAITILRPLLSLPKDSMIKTLSQELINPFHDKSNDDVTLTPRNSIRALLLRPKVLPKALQTDSIVSLSQRMATRNKQVDETVEWFLARCTIRHFRRSGVVEFFIPENLMGFPQQLMARVLGRLAEVISPMDRIDMTQMNRVAYSVMNTSTPLLPKHLKVKQNNLELRNLEDDYRETSKPTHYSEVSMTENNIFWEATYCKALFGQEAGILVRCFRQPFSTAAPNIPSNTPEIEMKYEEMNKWHLWDGRFWIRYKGDGNDELWEPIKTKSVRRLLITGTRNEVMFQMEKRNWVDPKEWREAAKKLKAEAPGKSRKVLPIICEHEKQSVRGWQIPYQPIFLPTFNVGADKGKDKWEWKPKKELVILGHTIKSVPTRVIDLN